MTGHAARGFAAEGEEFSEVLDAREGTWSPGKMTLTSRLPPSRRAWPGGATRPGPSASAAVAVQRRAKEGGAVQDPFAGVLDGPYLHDIAAAGVAGGGASLPHLEIIQAAFGSHDVTRVRAHTDGAAAQATEQLGAAAYARGTDVAFAGGAPSLHTAAHEAAHVIQQAGGVRLAGGLGHVGDVYEQQADAVADAVVRGESAAPLLDAMVAGSAGVSGVAVQRQPARAGTGGSAEAVTGLPLHPRARQLADAAARIRFGRRLVTEQVRKVRAGTQTSGGAATAVTGAIAALERDVALLVENHLLTRPAGAANQVRALVRQGLSADRHGEAARERAEVTLREDVIADLDVLAGDVLELARAHDAAAPELVALVQALDAVTTRAAGLGWQRPASLEQARERTYSREACPAGENDRSPGACVADHGDRVEKRVSVTDQLTKLVEAIFAACKAESDDFRKAIEADRKLVELISGFVVEVLLGVVTGGAGAVAGAGIAKPAVSAGVAKFAGDFGKSLLKTGVKAPASLGVGSGPDTDDPRALTISALEELGQQFEARIEAARESLRALDDAELDQLASQLQQYDKAQIKAHVHRFATAYLQQVAPIGLPRYAAPDGPIERQATARAVHVVLPGGRTRLALVEEVSDRAPGVRRGLRKAAVAAERLVSDADDNFYSGRLVRDRQDAWSDAPQVERTFIRWIDDPRMAAVAAADAPAIAVERITGVPLDALVDHLAADR